MDGDKSTRSGDKATATSSPAKNTTPQHSTLRDPDGKAQMNIPPSEQSKGSFTAQVATKPTMEAWLKDSHDRFPNFLSYGGTKQNDTSVKVQPHPAVQMPRGSKKTDPNEHQPAPTDPDARDAPPKKILRSNSTTMEMQ